jgi:TolC family type I secretion outer membrane protein
MIREGYMNRIISITLAIVFLSPLGAMAEDQTKTEAPVIAPESAGKPGIAPKTEESQASDSLFGKDEVLTLSRCVEIALRQQPSLLASMYTVNASQSKVGEAQSGYFPQVNISGGYNRIMPMPGSTSSTSPGFISTTAGSKAYDQYLGTAALTQMIYDFGKTPTQVSIAQLNLDASRSDLDATRAQTILAVKQAYFGLLKGQRNLDVAKETVGQYQQHLDQANGFFEVGVKPKFDVTKAEVDLSNSQLSLITADNALKIARVTLNNAMGLSNAPEYRIEDSLAFVKKDLTLAKAIDTTMQNRPEILATERRVKAAEENISLAKKGFFPVISGSAAYSRASINDATFKQDGWNAGVSVSIPIFSGFLTYHQVREADANYNAAKANYDLLKLNIVLEVQQAYLNLVAAADRIPTSELAQRQATENLDIASGRYAAGVGNPIEVTDAQVTYTNAKTTYTQALYDYNVAIANLDKSMGIK